MSNQIVISSGAKVRELEGVLTGTSGVVNSLAINVPNGIPQLDGSGKILVNQLPNSVMEYKGSWNAATNTPTLANGTGNAGDVYLCEVAGTVNFGAGPIAFFVGDQVVYSGTIWQRASGSTGTVTSVSVTESGDALSITGSPITTSGTINIGFTGTSGQYVNGAGGLTTFPTDNITGSGASGQVTYFNGTNTITGENAFNYDASTNRLGVNTTVPNATIGANAGTDSGYSLLLKNDNANYNGIGFATDSTYGNLIATEKLGTATTRNLTLLNQSGYISLTEAGNLGVNILNPNTGLDIYNSTTSSLWLHTATSGTSGTDGVRLALFNTNTANLRNFEGALSITAEGDFSIITIGAENFRVNSTDGSIYQSKVANAMLKSVSGVITAAVAGTDYVAPSSLSAYVPYTGATTNVNLGTHSLSAYNLIINHTSGSGVAASITKGGSGEALTVIKTSGSGNAASITGGVTLLSELHLTTALADAYIASAATWNAKMSGSGTSGQVAYFNGSNSITSEGGFIYDSSTNRLGVNTSVPNATIGADAGLDSGYGLLIKTGASNYNGIGIAVDSTYGNLISTEKLGTASARNLTLLNQSGFVSLRENGNFGVNTLNPAVSGTGIDVYSSTSTGIRFHTATSGTTVNDGAGINFSAGNNLGITNYENGTIDIVTNGNSGVFVASNGFVGINGATPSVALTVNGGAAISNLTTGQILFPTSGGTLAGSSSLFWDNTNAKLGIGTTTLSSSRVTITSPTEANHLHLVSNAPALSFTNATTATIFATIGMATSNNNFITGAVLGDFVLGAFNTNNIWFTNNNTNTVRMRLDSDGGGTFSSFVSASGPKSQIRVNGNSVGCGISLTHTIVGANRRNWGIFTEENVEGDFAIKCSTTSGGIAQSGNTRLAILNNGNVGIGTINPTDRLDVSGVLRVVMPNDPLTGAITAKILSFSPAPFGLVFRGYETGAHSIQSQREANDAQVYPLSLNPNGGAVGIGTTSPIGGVFRLQVGDGSADTRAIIVSNQVYQLGFRNGAANPVFYEGSDTSGNKIFSNNAGSELMRITSGGNVGIGTSSPLQESTNRKVLTINGTSQSIVNLGVGGVLAAYWFTTGTSSQLYSVGQLDFNTSNATGFNFNPNGVEAMRITSGGGVAIGTTAAGGTYKLRVINSSAVQGDAIFASDNNVYNSILVYAAGADGYNGAGTIAIFGRNTSTGRSINAGGTINASGADYAEYMTKAIEDNIAKGDIVGVDENGLLTNIFADAKSFVVKSTDPSYVGGDSWGNIDDIGKLPLEPTDKEKAEHQAKLEEARAKVDRIAFSGQVPCNVYNAQVGDYIIPIELDGKISGQAVSNPTFEQYQISVGKVWKIMEDGRAWIAVKIG